jgi:cytoplasmic iron level regulating protein YaaA (DUF328/UPF0246 family)
VLRKAQREGHWPHALDVLILSAKYGLIKPHELIDNYDLQMTRERAVMLQPTVSAELDKHLGQTEYRELFVNLGKNYLLAIADSKELSNAARRLYVAAGGIGKKASQMRTWLRACASKSSLSTFDKSHWK